VTSSGGSLPSLQRDQKLIHGDSLTKSAVRPVHTKGAGPFFISSDCVDRQLIKENPVKECTRIKHHEDPIPDHLTEEEVDLLRELTKRQRYVNPQNRDRLVFLLMLNAGLRRIEVATSSGPTSTPPVDVRPGQHRDSTHQMDILARRGCELRPRR